MCICVCVIPKSFNYVDTYLRVSLPSESHLELYKLKGLAEQYGSKKPQALSTNTKSKLQKHPR